MTSQDEPEQTVYTAVELIRIEGQRRRAEADRAAVQSAYRRFRAEYPGSPLTEREALVLAATYAESMVDPESMRRGQGRRISQGKARAEARRQAAEQEQASDDE